MTLGNIPLVNSRGYQMYKNKRTIMVNIVGVIIQFAIIRNNKIIELGQVLPFSEQTIILQNKFGPLPR